MSAIEDWLNRSRLELEGAGYVLEVRRGDQVTSIIGESPAAMFSLVEWPDVGLEFHAISVANDKVISVAEASKELSVEEKCDYYISSMKEYLSALNQ